MLFLIFISVFPNPEAMFSGMEFELSNIYQLSDKPLKILNILFYPALSFRLENLLLSDLTATNLKQYYLH